jgi:rhodanese-related sulfurtransferase
MQALQLLGYTNVKSLVGGMTAWKSANLPVMTGTPPEAPAGKTPVVDKDLLTTLDTYLSSLPDGWNTISPVTLSQLLKTSQPFQIDVREPKEIVDSGFIAHSTNIPIRTFFTKLNQLPPDKGATIIIECDNGQRSAMVMMALSLLGYTNVRNLAGGLATWEKMGLPISK